MFLPASEPARSEALALLKKTHHLPRHLVRGIVPGIGKRATAPVQDQQQTFGPSDPLPPDPQVQVG